MNVTWSLLRGYYLVKGITKKIKIAVLLKKNLSL